MNNQKKKRRAHPNARTFRKLRRYIRLNNVLFSPHSSFWIIIGGFALIVVGVFFFFWQEPFGFRTSLKLDEIAQFGDFIGGIVGSIWALSGVILFYVALSLQRKEFQLQRQELRETRSIFEQQAAQMKTQQKESTFFNLLNHHNQTVSNITSNGTSSTPELLNGNNALRSIWNDLKMHWQHINSEGLLRLDVTYSTLLYNHPYLALSRHDSFRQIFYSVNHLFFFIKNHLDNDPFYIQILLNNLSKEEKEIVSVINEYGLYSELEKIDLSENSLSFDVDLYSNTWFIPTSNFPPRVRIEFNKIQIPVTEMGRYHTVSGLVIFNDPIDFIDYGINIAGTETKLEEFNIKFNDGQAQKISISPDILLEISNKHIMDKFEAKPKIELYFNICFNGNNYRIVNHISYIKNERSGESFNFS